jgi:HAD superfamily phosphoserine phosphatase-like hydrolase
MDREAGKTMRIALFDVCGTLYDADTTLDFLRWYFRKTRSPHFLLFKFGRSLPGKLVLYLLGKLGWHGILKWYGTRALRGVSRQAIEQASAEFVNTVLAKKQNQTIVDLLRQYQQQGYHILLLSGSYSFIVAEVARYFDAHTFRASELAMIDGTLSGAYADDIIHKKKEVFQSLYDDFSELVVVTDNRGDLELMKIASYAYAVYKKPRSSTFWVAQNLAHVQLMQA